MWCDEVNSVFQLNLASIDKVHKILTNRPDKYAKNVIKKMIDMVTMKVPLVSLADAYHCFGMC